MSSFFIPTTRSTTVLRHIALYRTKFNQLTVVNSHVGYVLFTVVMTTFTLAPSSGVPYADALFIYRINV